MSVNIRIAPQEQKGQKLARGVFPSAVSRFVSVSHNKGLEEDFSELSQWVLHCSSDWKTLPNKTYHFPYICLIRTCCQETTTVGAPKGPCCSWVPPTAALGFAQGCSEVLLDLVSVKGTVLRSDFLMVVKGRAVGLWRTRPLLLKSTLHCGKRWGKRIWAEKFGAQEFVLFLRIWFITLA